ncbi:hypothetical protein NLI96_g13046 [Meripilus lineatus]|uniref:Uncharacterized protein n=1 Tax=Meripilus lineatus TaxID=2056292 RepID=A0AAD5YBU6_9APHY|nr:hypothetical protein NLI96_g13046 [Physisporinus lineatus]
MPVYHLTQYRCSALFYYPHRLQPSTASPSLVSISIKCYCCHNYYCPLLEQGDMTDMSAGAHMGDRDGRGDLHGSGPHWTRGPATIREEGTSTLSLDAIPFTTPASSHLPQVMLASLDKVNPCKPKTTMPCPLKPYDRLPKGDPNKRTYAQKQNTI